MNTPFSPYSLVREQLVRQLRELSAEAESAGTLTDGQLNLIQREGWFRMFLPRSLGGLELSLPEGLCLEEALAWIDGSLGWTVTLCSGATMFAGYMDPSVAGPLVADADACFGGSGAVSGTATALADGSYLVSGSWRYATGAPHLTVFTANCKIEQDGRTVMDESGQPLSRSFFFLREEVSIKADWHTMGLTATAGHTFEISRLIVPPSRVFRIEPAAAKSDYPVFHYPFLPFAEATLAVNTSGMTLRFLDICAEIFARRGSDKNYREDVAMMLDAALMEARHELTELRNNFYRAVDQSWEPLTRQGIARPDALDAVSAASRTLVRACRQLVLGLYPYCGMAAADPRTELNRVWRDLFTASQHTLLTYPVL